MIILHFLISFIIWLATLPIFILSFIVVPLLLITKWDARSTVFGNFKWGRATDHYLYPTRNNYWREFVWLVLRNPIYNFDAVNLAVNQKPYTLVGDPEIGDKLKGGFYRVKMGWAWEYYWIKPYTLNGQRRCIRLRIGWKIAGNDTPTAQFVFSVNPIRKYLGA